MQTVADAVEVYFKREAEAMQTPKGADHKAILRAVSEESGFSYEDLRTAVLDASTVRAN